MVTAADLLSLVRKLIDYGRDLAATLHQRHAENPYFTRTCFGTSDLKLVLARITRGLQLAGLLEDRLTQRGARPSALPGIPAMPSPHTPRNPRLAAPPTERIDAGLAGLLTPEEIAAKFLRQPIGVAIADICRELGIMPSHPLWREVALAMTVYGGNVARLLKDVINRAFEPMIADEARRGTPLFLPRPVHAGTGPP